MSMIWNGSVGPSDWVPLTNNTFDMDIFSRLNPVTGKWEYWDKRTGEVTDTCPHIPTMQELLDSTTPSNAGSPNVGEGVRWRERWYGSEPQKGSAIVDEHGNLIAYLGGNEDTHRVTTAIVAAHNAALATIPTTPKVLLDREILARARTGMALLQQNSEGCALNHYGSDLEEYGMPGWLIDTKADLGAFTDLLAAPAYTPRATSPTVPAIPVDREQPMCDPEINWLVHQLEAWPHRVDPERTTNIETLMQMAARHIRATPLAASPAYTPRPVEESREGCVGTMTAERATYFLERFKREEKLLGPHEQWALDYTIAALARPVEAGAGQ